MNDVRDNTLFAKKEEIVNVVVSRKRKLRELYAVARYAEPIPSVPLNYNLGNELPYDTAESAFLEANDILKGLYFDESTLPARPARAPTLDAKSGTFATNTSIPQFTKPSSVGPRAVRNGSSNELAAGVQEQSRKLSQGGDFTSEFGSGWKEDGAPTPKSIGGTTKEPLRPDTSQIFRSDAYIPPTSRSSPPGERLIQVVDNNRDELGQSLPSQRSLEDDRIKSTIESPDGSPGVDPAKAMPISSEEVATLSAPLVAHSGLDGHHVARTIHLPARGTQERHARAIGEAHDREKQRDTGDEREGGRTQPSGPPGSVEPESSPSSTTGAYSTNTPGLNAASPDTSPDDEQPLDNAGALRSKVPPDLVPNEGERLAKVEHDTLLKSQMQIAHTDAFAQTISNPDAQLRLEEEQAARGGASSGNVESGTTALPDTVPTSDQLLEAVGRSPLTTRASELVQGIMEDEEDEVVGVPTPEGNAMLHDRRKSPPISTSGLDIPSSSSQDAAPSLAAVEYSSRVNVELGPTRQNHGPASRNSALTPIRTDLSVPPKDDSAGEGINRRPLTGLVDSPEALEASVRSRPDLDEDTVMQDGSVVGNAAPLKSVSTPTSVQSPPERMTTRVSSGALRHKSVSEILGETPKPLLNKISTPASKPESTSQPPTPTTESNEPHSPLAIIRNGERREKERSKLSTVIFAKQQRQSKADSSPLSQRKASSVGQVMEDDKDYFYPLFAQTASHSRSPQLHKLLETARKTISTADLYVNAHEQQDCRILRRIYQLQFANRWSLRQMERSIEPPRPKAHWDSLLDEMKWMRTDFREERKWKIAAAKNLADWCAQWVASSPEARTFLQVRVKVMYPASKTGGISRDAGVTGDSVRSEGTIESHLTSSESITDTKAVGDNINLLNPCEAPAPAGIFSLGAGEITFGMKKTPSSDRLLAELPIYEPFGREPDVDLSKSEVSADSDWKTSILPITKYAMAKILSKEDGPPRKRSRYDYDDEGDEGSLDLRSDFEKLRAGIGTTTKPSPSVLPSEQNDVALFNPDNKHIRDRIHASHAFRPPSEYNMPSQSFFENRTSSQWTWSEDVQLRELVRGYSYNWSLISSIMSPQSIFSSGAERRTPWECFERWIGLEGLPGDMQKTQYFRAYHSRLDAAQRNVAAQQQAVSQQGSSAGPPSTPLRRRTTLPIKVDRRRNNKHLALVDAMRKLAKKRETTLSKQQHSAAMAASRKANEAPQTRNPMQTPQEFSRMKHDREQKMQKAAEVYRQNVLQQQRAAMQQQRSIQQAGGQHNLPNGTGHQPRNGTPGTGNAASPAVGSSVPKANGQPGHPNQPRQHSSLQPLSNGIPNQQVAPMPSGVNPNVQMGIKGVPQAQMQSSAQVQQRPPPQMGPDNMRVIMEATRVQQEQQRFLNQQRHQQQVPHFSGQAPHHNQTGPSSSPNMGHANGASPHNPALLAAMHAAANVNGNSMSSANGISTVGGSSSSPQMAQSHPNQPQHLSSGHVPAVTNISHQLKARNPQMSNDQITKLTNDHLAAQYRNSMTQAAINAAAGGSGNNNQNANNTTNQHAHQQNQQQAGMPNGGSTGQLNYAQMMRVQQANQSRGNNPGARPPSRSSTPQTGPRSGSVQAGQGQNQSPRPPQAQMAGGQ